MTRSMTTRGWYQAYYAPDCRQVADEAPRVGLYGSYIFADNYDQALQFAAQRHLGERVEALFIPIRNKIEAANGKRWPYTPPSAMLGWKPTYWRKKDNRLEFIHAVTFLSFLAVRSKVIRADLGVLGDGGILHEAIHCMQFGRPSRNKLREWLQGIEAAVPGYVPPELRQRAALGE